MTTIRISSGLSLPKNLFEQIEQARGYESRSHFIQRILSSALNKTAKERGTK